MAAVCDVHGRSICIFVKCDYFNTIALELKSHFLSKFA